MRSQVVMRCLLLLALLLGGLFSPGCGREVRTDREWPYYLGDPFSNQYSPLNQINRENVKGLKVAWIHRTGDAREDNRSQIQCNPIVVEGILYGTSPKLKVFALDAATGAQKWIFDPFAGAEHDDPLGVNRGLVYWESGVEKRILFTAGHYLYSLDAITGGPDLEFGIDGHVDLREGLGRDSNGLFISSNTPGVIYKDLLILGSRVSEGPGPSAPGHIRAYKVRTGDIQWVFHTIPQPGEYGYETWPEDAWRTAGGANSWAGMSLDEGRGVVYVPTGSPAFDFWGGNRHGQNLFGNCILALNADTGEHIWHFQVVSHDLWDRDLPAPPNLVTLRHEGREVDALAQITKSGHVFVLNRDTGEPLFPLEEIEVPSSDLRGEEAWPTQVFPLQPKPFARQSFTEADITDISPESREHVLERFKGVRTGRQFIPPSVEGTMIFPGFDGGGEWGGAGFDLETNTLYVNANEMPWILTMVDVEEKRRQMKSLGEKSYTVNCAVCHGENRLGDEQNTYPPLLDLNERYDRESLFTVVENGKGFMPGYEYLDSAEKDALVSYLLDLDEGESQPEPDSSSGSQGVVYSHTGYNRFLDQDGYPAVRPPWGTLNAIDLDSGEFRWTVPLGEFDELTARGLPPTGTENYGGPVVTAGGLVFIAASKDERFRAFDKDTGEELWRADLPAGGYATPCTFEVNGKQYVVIAAGGGKMGTKSGDAYVAFTLPD